MMKKGHRWIFRGLLLLFGLLASMAGFAEGEPVPYARNCSLGAVLISTSDTSPADDSAANVHRFAMLGLPPTKGSSNFPTLFRFEQVRSAEERSHRSFPLYRYRHDLTNDETDFDTLLLYRHDLDETSTVDHLFTFDGYRTQPGVDTQDIFIGPPPFGRSPAWSLYEQVLPHITEINRLFPVYRDTHDESSGQSTITVLGGESVSLFQSRRSLWENSQHAFPPYGLSQGTVIKTYSLTETVLIIGVYVVLGILSPNCERNKSWYPGKPFDYRCDR